MAYIVGVIGENAVTGVRSLDPASTEIQFVSGSLRGSADDLRITTIVLETQDAPAKVVELRLKIQDQRFAEYTLTGKIRGAGKRVPQEIL